MNHLNNQTNNESASNGDSLTNQLTQLQQYTTVVADTGDLTAIATFTPQDATTNPSLITAAASLPETQPIIDALYEQLKSQVNADQLVDSVIDDLTIQLGVQISKLIKGRVSTEVDAELSYQTDATVAKGRHIIAQYAQHGVAKERVLIKIAATWQGIKAAEILEKEGISCNLTLLFGMHQAIACAEANVTLISPFVGRILDWYKADTGTAQYPIEQDPGVVSVKQIYTYYKQHGYTTEVMGASFRSVEQVLALAGCDLLTIAPNLLAQLQQSHAPVLNQLQYSGAILAQPTTTLDAEAFATAHSSNRMANDLLDKGIQGFIKARADLHALLTERFATKA